jgi:hypothetical protein
MLLAVPPAARACWMAEDMALAKQMADSDTWGLIRVLSLAYSEPGQPVWTSVTFEFVDESGDDVGVPQTLWYEGALLPGGGGLAVSTSPRMKPGEYYVVLLRSEPKGYMLTLDRASALPVTLGGAVVTPQAFVDLEPEHGIVLPGETEPTPVAELGDLLDALDALAAAEADKEVEP